MAQVQTPLDFTDKDFVAIKAALDTELATALPKFTDRSDASFGNVTMGMYAYILDIVAHYQDGQAGEAHWLSLKQRKSLISLSAQIAFKPRSAKAALVTIRLTIAAVAADDVNFVVLQKVETPDNVEFETQAAAVITVGNTFVDVVAHNSKTFSKTFAGTGEADQEFLLDRAPYVDGSASVLVDGVGFTEVPSFLDSTAASKHFRVIVNENDQATIRFGNGVNGQKPGIASVILVGYETGGGLDGNVGAGTITEIDGDFFDDSSNPVDVTVNNTLAAQGGEDREKIEEARERGPLTLRQLGNRTVAKDDYVAHAEEVSGVLRALAVGKADDPTLLANQVEVDVVPDDLGTPSAALKAAVLDNLTVKKPNTIGIAVTVKDATYNTIPITADITLAMGAVEATVDLAIRAALTALFAPKNADGTRNNDIDFGVLKNNKVTYALLYSTVVGVDGVADVDEDAFIPADSVVLTNREFPKIGAITLVFV